MKIGAREVGPGQPTYVIFEVASTHGGDFDTAAAYVAQAKEASADAVKYQLFEADKLIVPLTPGLKGTYDYFKTTETPHAWYPKLKKLCDEAGIDLLCTPFDPDAASFLNEVGVPAIKIASGELTNMPLLERVATFGKPIIMSTGMATMEEVAVALKTLRAHGAKDIVLLQCVSVYPTSFEDANVRAMQTLAREFGTLAGYSDNGSRGELVPLMATAMGACVIEKHVTSKKERGAIDDVFSMSVEQFAAMVKRIREIEKRPDKDAVLAELKKEYGDDFNKALGDGIKRPVGKEVDERKWARRGVYLKEPVKKGTMLTEDVLVLLRPDVGISALRYKELPGTIAGEDLSARVPLRLTNKEVFQLPQ